MSLDDLRSSMPPYAKDIKLNLGTVLGQAALTEEQLWGTVLATAAASRNADVLAELSEEARGHLSPEAFQAALGAAVIMGMNNVYYRATHLMGDSAYENMPPKLRMQIIGNPGVAKETFELWAFAVSAINGCGQCMVSHEHVVTEAGISKETVHEALRVASVVHAAAVAADTAAVIGSIDA